MHSEIIVIDNFSITRLPNEIVSQNNLKIIHNKINLGYGKAINQGVKISKGNLLLFVNPDTIFQKNSIKLMVNKINSNKEIGIIGPQFLNSDKTVQITGNGIPFAIEAIFSFSFLKKIFPNNIYFKRYYLPEFNRKVETEIPAICGACMLMNTHVYKELKGFDEQFFMYFEELDLCLRIKKAGYKILYYPKAKVIHLGGGSSDDKMWIKKTFEESRYKFLRKYNNSIIAMLTEGFLRIINNI